MGVILDSLFIIFPLRSIFSYQVKPIYLNDHNEILYNIHNRGLSFKNLDNRERITSHFIADLRKSPVSNMNVHNKWSTSSCHSSSSKLSTLATATTLRNSSDAGSSRNNSPTNISGTWSNSCRSFDTFDSDVEDEFVRRRRGIIISYLLLVLRFEEDNKNIFRK